MLWIPVRTTVGAACSQPVHRLGAAVLTLSVRGIKLQLEVIGHHHWGLDHQPQPDLLLPAAGTASVIAVVSCCLETDEAMHARSSYRVLHGLVVTLLDWPHCVRYWFRGAASARASSSALFVDLRLVPAAPRWDVCCGSRSLFRPGWRFVSRCIPITCLAVPRTTPPGLMMLVSAVVGHWCSTAARSSPRCRWPPCQHRRRSAATGRWPGSITSGAHCRGRMSDLLYVLEVFILAPTISAVLVSWIASTANAATSTLA